MLQTRSLARPDYLIKSTTTLQSTNVHWGSEGFSDLPQAVELVQSKDACLLWLQSFLFTFPSQERSDLVYPCHLPTAQRASIWTHYNLFTHSSDRRLDNLQFFLIINNPMVFISLCMSPWARVRGALGVPQVDSGSDTVGGRAPHLQELWQTLASSAGAPADMCSRCHPPSATQRRLRVPWCAISHCFNLHFLRFQHRWASFYTFTGCSTSFCELLLICYGLNCVSPERYWRANSQYLWLWSYLEIGALQLIKMRS